MDNWDREIDEVARHMTEGGPGANFKAQVLARIEAVHSRRRPRRLVWTGSAVALAATGAMVFISVRPAWKTDTVRLKPDTSDTARLKPEASDTIRREPDPLDAAGLKLDTKYDELPAGGAVTAADGAARAPAPTVSRDRSSGMSGLSGTGAAAPRATGPTIASDRIDGLQPLPIQVEQLAVDAMESMAAIQVQGLDIAPLEVPALTIALLDVPILADESFEGRVR